jgi:hypothetical protein
MNELASAKIAGSLSSQPQEKRERDLATAGIPPQVQESPVRCSTPLVVMSHPLCHDSAQMFLAQWDHEIQTLTAMLPTKRSQ